MQLDSIELFQITVPLKRSFGPPTYRQTALPCVLAKIWIGDAFGWGEISADALPCLQEEWAEGVFFAAQSLLAPTWIGEQFNLPSELLDKWTPFQGANSAKYLLECALLDACAKIARKPVYEYIRPDVPGGFESPGNKSEKNYTSVPVYISFDQEDDFETFCNRIEKAVADGYRFFEIKIRPGWDISMLNAVVPLLDGAQFHLSFEGGLTEKQSDLLYRFADFQPLFFDQPFASQDWVLAAQMQDAISVPFGLSQGVDRPADLEIAADLGAGRIIGVNPQQTGGLLAGKKILSSCLEFNVASRVWNRLSTPLGQRQAFALACQEKNAVKNIQTHIDSGSKYPLSYWNPEEWFEQNLFAPMETTDSDLGKMVKPWSDFGWGIEPDLDLLDDCMEQTFEIS